MFFNRKDLVLLGIIKNYLKNKNLKRCKEPVLEVDKFGNFYKKNV